MPGFSSNYSMYRLQQSWDAEKQITDTHLFGQATGKKFSVKKEKGGGK